jgi:hypothetical protein
VDKVLEFSNRLRSEGIDAWDKAVWRGAVFLLDYLQIPTYCCLLLMRNM